MKFIVTFDYHDCLVFVKKMYFFLDTNYTIMLFVATIVDNEDFA